MRLPRDAFDNIFSSLSEEIDYNPNATIEMIVRARRSGQSLKGKNTRLLKNVMRILPQIPSSDIPKLIADPDVELKHFLGGEHVVNVKQSYHNVLILLGERSSCPWLMLPPQLEAHHHFTVRCYVYATLLQCFLDDAQRQLSTSPQVLKKGLHSSSFQWKHGSNLGKIDMMMERQGYFDGRVKVLSFERWRFSSIIVASSLRRAAL